MSTTNKFQYLTFTTIGISLLWPWNSLLLAVPYFTQRLVDHPILQRTTSSNIMFISTLTSTILFIYFVFKKTEKNINSTAVYSLQVIIGELVIALTFLMLAVSCLFSGGVNSIVYFLFVLLITFVSTVGTALTQNGSFAVVNLFDPIYTQAIMTGQAIAGILTPVLFIWSQLGSKGNSSSSTEDSTVSEPGDQALPVSSFLSFFISSLISMLALYLYNLLIKKTPERMLSLSFLTRRSDIYSIVTLGQTGQDHRIDNNNDDDDIVIDDFEGTGSDGPKNSLSAFQLVYQRLRIPALTIVLTFSISLQFPVFLPVVKPINSSYDETIFSTLALFSWNLGDLLGRVVCGLKSFSAAKPGSSKFYLSYSVARFVFIPLLFLCNINGKGALFNSDVFYILLMFLYGLTNGHLSTRVMMLASTMNKPESVLDRETFLSPQSPDEGGRENREKEATGSFMTLAISLGLTCGSLFSFVLVYII